jgi:hypothetical protein
MYTVVKESFLPTDIDMLIEQSQRDNDVYASAPGSSLTNTACTCSECTQTCYGNTVCAGCVTSGISCFC